MKVVYNVAKYFVLFMTWVTKWNSSRLGGERIWIFKLSLTSDIYVVQRYGMLSSWSSRTRKANINICNKKYRWISEPRKFYEDVERDKYGEIRLITHHWQQVHVRPGLFYHNSIELAKHDPRRWFFGKQMTHRFIEEGKKNVWSYFYVSISPV